MLKRCQSSPGFLLQGFAALLAIIAIITLFDQDTSDTSAFFGLCMFGVMTGVPGLFLCLRAAEMTPTYKPGFTGRLHKTLVGMACCKSALAAAFNAIALILFGIMLLMIVDALVNNDPNAQGGAIGVLIMTVMFGLLGRTICKPRVEMPSRPNVPPTTQPVARSLGNIKVVRLACPSCNASIPAELLMAGKSHLTCPYCGSDVIVQEAGKAGEK